MGHGGHECPNACANIENDAKHEETSCGMDSTVSEKCIE